MQSGQLLSKYYHLRGHLKLRFQGWKYPALTNFAVLALQTLLGCMLVKAPRQEYLTNKFTLRRTEIKKRMNPEGMFYLLTLL